MAPPDDVKLTPVQFEIMQVIWNAAGGATVAEIWEVIAANREVGRTTVLNLVNRLEARGWLRRQKHEGVYRYEATVGRGRRHRRCGGKVRRRLLRWLRW